MQEERRQHVRYSVEIPARVESDKQACVKDISAGGIAIKTSVELEKESNVQFRFLIERNNVRCDGQIRVKLTKGNGFLYGVEFDKSKIKITTKLVERRDKIQFVEMNNKK